MEYTQEGKFLKKIGARNDTGSLKSRSELYNLLPVVIPEENENDTVIIEDKSIMDMYPIFNELGYTCTTIIGLINEDEDLTNRDEIISNLESKGLTMDDIKKFVKASMYRFSEISNLVNSGYNQVDIEYLFGLDENISTAYGINFNYDEEINDSDREIYNFYKPCFKESPDCVFLAIDNYEYNTVDDFVADIQENTYLPYIQDTSKSYCYNLTNSFNDEIYVEYYAGKTMVSSFSGATSRNDSIFVLIKKDLASDYSPIYGNSNIGIVDIFDKIDVTVLEMEFVMYYKVGNGFENNIYIKQK